MKINNYLPVKILSTSNQPTTALPDKTQSVAGKSNFTVGHLPLQVGSEPGPVLTGKKGASQTFLQQIMAEAVSPSKAILDLFAIAASSQGKLPAGLSAQLDALLLGFKESSINNIADPLKMVKLLSWLTSGKSNISEQLSRQLAAFLITIKETGSHKLLNKATLSGLQKLAGTTDALINFNNQPSTGNQPLLLLFPCLFAAGAGWGQWLYALDAQTDNHSQDEPINSYSLNFFLEMSRIGNIHIRMNIRNDTLQGEFMTDDQEVHDYLTSQLPTLKQLMHKLSYHKVSFSCRLTNDNLMQIIKDELAQKTQTTNINIIDIKA